MLQIRRAEYSVKSGLQYKLARERRKGKMMVVYVAECERGAVKAPPTAARQQPGPNPNASQHRQPLSSPLRGRNVWLIRGHPTNTVSHCYPTRFGCELIVSVSREWGSIDAVILHITLVMSNRL